VDELDKLQAQLELYYQKTVLTPQEVFDMYGIIFRMSGLALDVVNTKIDRLAERVEKLEDRTPCR